jgi:hypothetical protein
MIKGGMDEGELGTLAFTQPIYDTSFIIKECNARVGKG